MDRLTDPAPIAPYLSDASNLAGGFAQGVVVPRTEEEVVEFLRKATASGWPVTVAGHGSGLVGGRVPFGGWVLSTERLSGLRAVKRMGARGGIAVVGPGMPLGRLQDAAGARGLFYPPDPTERDAFIGGTVSTNASGARSFKYGATRAQVRALRVVLADGQTLALRRGVRRARAGRLRLETEQGRRLDLPVPRYRMPRTKHAAGYFARRGLDAVDLFIGAEGTLGVVTEIELALRTAPEEVWGFWAFFRLEEAAWRFAIRARALSRRPRRRLEARALEYLDRGALELLRPRYPEVPRAVRAAVYVEQEAAKGAVETQLTRWRREAREARGLRDALWVFRTPTDLEALKAFRRALPLAVNEQRRRVGHPKVGTDVAVPDAGLPKLMRLYRALLDQAEQATCLFGHIGDNHLHANFMPEHDAGLTAARRIHVELARAAVALGGTVSAEHGIGKLKRTFLGLLYSPGELEAMRRLKRTLDPRWLLGQGTLFER